MATEQDEHNARMAKTDRAIVKVQAIITERNALRARVRELERTIEQMCEQIAGLPGSRETVTAMMLGAAVLPKVLDE